MKRIFFSLNTLRFVLFMFEFGWIFKAVLRYNKISFVLKVCPLTS